MSNATTAYQVGAEYAEQMFGENCTEQVDVDRQMGSTQEIPDGDYCWMNDRGINPDSREYWRGYNDKMAELSA